MFNLKLCCFLAVAVSCLSSGLNAEQITRFRIAETEAVIAVNPPPLGCATNFHGFHAIINDSHDHFEDIVYMIQQVNRLSKQVDLVFSGDGPCDQKANLLQIESISIQGN